MTDEVLDFIKRRFDTDCHWTDGNCYYFSVILKDRFMFGDIVYDTMQGHFYFLYQNRLYDYKGCHEKTEDMNIIPWQVLEGYDKSQYERIVRDCLF